MQKVKWVSGSIKIRKDHLHTFQKSDLTKKNDSHYQLLQKDQLYSIWIFTITLDDFK